MPRRASPRENMQYSAKPRLPRQTYPDPNRPRPSLRTLPRLPDHVLRYHI